MRYALGIEYDGTDFLGWQRLGDGPSVQAALETALSYVADHPVAVTCAGRTDSGVHGRGQVVHFDSDADRTPRAWLMGSNARLPDSVATLWAQPVSDEFHARFAARARRYRYRLLNRRVRPALDARYVAWERRPLDADAMHRAAQALVGEHDFSAFRAIQCQAKHARRHLQRIAVTRIDDEVVVEVQANAFLHHMVRNIVGSLMLIGRGEQPEDWMATLLAGRDRTVAGPTAPSAGLLFLGPLYPAQWQLPAEVTL
ncbi:tRNA pseudouridine(38-40) synthase TruA [Chiayiivirga flava]|uniref:tRNA pseudouridine synthase A n=1 Tax=Chiayiivirga flava TaxID=659595 RepID=A0A7W8D2G9_9GAMM|nr:tRNA pseudouridine(38-40) synthase TruA [Chiayiivirga flava]MBB5206674.1 tRNA pseudouridine38-40 synthase [Chiayiivirga flava]